MCVCVYKKRHAGQACVLMCVCAQLCVCVYVYYIHVCMFYMCVCVYVYYIHVCMFYMILCVYVYYIHVLHVCVCVLHTSAQQGAGVKLAAQAPALSQGAAALLLGGVEAEPAAGALVCHVVVTLPDLARPGGR